MNIARYLIDIGLKFDTTNAPRTVMALDDCVADEVKPLDAADIEPPKFHFNTLDLSGSVPIDDSDGSVVAALLENASATCASLDSAQAALQKLTYFGPYVLIRPGKPGIRESRHSWLRAEITTPVLQVAQLLVQVTTDVVRMVVLPDGKVVPQVRRGQRGNTGIAIVRTTL